MELIDLTVGMQWFSIVPSPRWRHQWVWCRWRRGIPAAGHLSWDAVSTSRFADQQTHIEQSVNGAIHSTTKYLNIICTDELLCSWDIGDNESLTTTSLSY